MSISDNKDGFSLIEILIGIGVTALVGLASASIYTHLNSSISNVSSQRDMDSLYSLGVQMSRLRERTGEIVGILDDRGEIIESHLTNCLKGVGSNCLSYVKDWQPLKDKDDDLNADFGPTGKCRVGGSQNCNLRRSVSYKWNCQDAKTCSSLSVMVTVKRLKSDMKYTPRSGEFDLSARYLIGVGSVRFTCGVLPVQGVNFKDQVDICLSPLPTMDCGGPMRTFLTGSNCQPPVSSSCGEGFSQIGIANASSQCRGMASVTPPPPPPDDSTPPDCKGSFAGGQMCDGDIIAGAWFPGGKESCRSFCDGVGGTKCCSGATSPGFAGVFCTARNGSPVAFVNTYKDLSPEMVKWDGTTTDSVVCGDPAPSASTDFGWSTMEYTCYINHTNFPAQSYLNVNPDVKALCGDDLECAYNHFFKYGLKEDRSISAKYAARKDDFMEQIKNYMIYSPDVLLAGVDPWVHFQICGNFEGRVGISVPDWQD